MNYYLSFKQYLTNLHNTKIWRIPISTGFPCPNRMDKKTGCSFCDGKSFIAPYMKEISIEEQLRLGMDFFGKKFNASFFYGYFQENTSTYGPLTELIQKFRTVLMHEKIKGLIISTRPDYVYKEIIESLEELKLKYNKDLWIELGLQSINDTTLERINRGHTYQDFKNAVKLINELSNIKICVHMIIGLPGESIEIIKNGIITVFKENKLNGLKLRLLDILPNTLIEKDYKQNPKDFHVFKNEEYIQLLCDIFERIPENIVIMRTLNYNPVNILNNEEKVLTKDEILNALNEEFKKRNTRQGIFY